jgi:hypothetical protein
MRAAGLGNAAGQCDASLAPSRRPCAAHPQSSEWRAYAFRRLRRAINLTADPVLVELLREIQSFPEAASPAEPAEDQVIVRFRVRTSVGVLSFFTTIMVFGTPIDVSLSELALESFLPADKETAEIVARLPPT